MNVPQHVRLHDVFRTANKIAGRIRLTDDDPRWSEFEEQLSGLVVVWFDGLSPFVLRLELWEALSGAGDVVPFVTSTQKGDW
jgi:hypothetical protein